MVADSSIRVVVGGLIGQYPIGGNAWAYIQYVLGLHEMGHDVYYLEDTGQWPYNPEEGGISPGCDYNVRYIDDIMSSYGLSDRWAYRFPHGPQWFGMSDAKREEVVRTADLVINVSGTYERPGELAGRARLAYVDTDPVFTQVKLARGQEDFRRLVDLHDVWFTFGEAPSIRVPDTGHAWQPTCQPVVLDEWQPVDTHRGVFTTVMNWTSYKPIEYEGQTYGQKDVEFMRFLELPERVAPTKLELAVNAGKTRRTPYDRLRHEGWEVVDPEVVCPDLGSYRDYVRSSMAEWTVAKNGYVVGRSGWFSERSAVYLAAGRPVVTQDTGFGSVLPTGEGLFAFATIDEAVGAIAEVTGDHSRHSKAAHSVAQGYFDSAKVLGSLIERASG